MLRKSLAYFDICFNISSLNDWCNWAPIIVICAQTEVDYLGKLRHKNLVKLIGYCEDSENRLLVYEFMPKGSLENHLFRSEFISFFHGWSHEPFGLSVRVIIKHDHLVFAEGTEPMAWATRMRIAIDVAQGLAFLHSKEPSIIYRDLKASNILLDAVCQDYFKLILIIWH